MINRKNCLWGKSSWFDTLCQKNESEKRKWDLKPLNAVGGIPLRDAEATSPMYALEIPLLSLGIKGFLRTVLKRLGMLHSTCCFATKDTSSGVIWDWDLYQDAVILPLMSFVPQQCQDIPAARLKRKKGRPSCGFTSTQPELVSCTCSGAGIYEILTPEWLIYGNWDTLSNVSISEIYKWDIDVLHVQYV